jgi:heme/copper-type cytochrome/quinol oxidase subunit 4
MSRMLLIAFAIVVSLTFTALAPSIVPALAENRTLLRVVRFLVVLVAIRLAMVLFNDQKKVAT